MCDGCDSVAGQFAVEHLGSVHADVESVRDKGWSGLATESAVPDPMQRCYFTSLARTATATLPTTVVRT